MNSEETPVVSAPAPGFSIPRQELRIIVIYLIVATMWIVGSDKALEVWTGDPPQPLGLQTLKGLNFVFTTAVLFYVVLTRSFNRRRRAESHVRDSRERFELIARAASDALWDWNLLNNKIEWSDGFQKLFGHPKEEVEPTIESWTSRIHPDDRERTIRQIHRVIDSGATAWWDEYRFLKHDGTYASVMDRGYVIRDNAGKPVRMVGGITDVSRQREAEQEILRSRQRLRALSLRLESLREAEHSRISRQIHDDLGQKLTALKMDLRWIEKRLEDHDGPALNPIVDKLIEAVELADECIKSAQEVSAELRPGLLDQLGLPAALRCEGGRFQERSGILCTVSLPEPPPEVPDELATAMFRITREALTNVIRHAQATAVEIALRENPDSYLLTITDNGRGIPPDKLKDPGSLGLFGMRERAGPFGGEVAFGPGPDHRGATVTLKLPRPEGAAAGTSPRENQLPAP